MIVCSCFGKTDRDVLREGPEGLAGTGCGGCKPTIAKVLEGARRCVGCEGFLPSGPSSLAFGFPICTPCFTIFREAPQLLAANAHRRTRNGESNG